MNIAIATGSAGAAGQTAAAPLRVWSIVTSLTTGGAESLIASLNPCFAEGNVEHTVLALCDAATVGNSAATELRMAGKIELEGGKFVSLDLGRWRDPVSGALALNRLLRHQMPDVIHAHTARAIPMISGSRFGGPVVLTHHNSRLSFPRIFFRYIDTVVDSYVAISKETEEIYKSQCRKPARRISNGVSSAFFAQTERRAPHKPCRIMSVGAISDQKNYDLLLATAGELQSRASEAPIAVFNIAGAGDGLEAYRQKVRDRGLEGIVNFLGERSDVPQLLADADLFLNTSHYEGQSVAMLEAMAMALPVVATDVPGNRDLVAHGQNGLLAVHNDPGQLADAVLRLIEQPDTYAALSSGAHAAGMLFSVEKTATSHLELYRSLASKG